MKKLLILDSNSIINRAFYGIKFLSAPDGTPTNGIYGFMNILFKLLNDEKPDYLCAAFDLKAPTFRHKMYSEYKAQRKPMPDGLRVQLPFAKDILRAMNVPILELEGYEADDIIGTVSRICEAEGVECLIATGDKDDLQLATDKTKVILSISRMGVTETNVYDADGVIGKYGVTPTEFIDVKALMGDPSDNIPGVAGIGEKTAIKLIKQFSSIENLYNNLDESGLKGATLEKIKNGRESAFMSKTLATIDTNAPLKFSFSDSEFSEKYNDSEFFELLTKLGLNSFIKKLNLSDTLSSEKSDEFFSNLEIKAISTAEQWNAVKNELKNFVCVLVHFCDNKIIGATLAYDNKAIHITSPDTEAIVCDVLNNPDIKKITFNIKDTLVALYGKVNTELQYDDLAIAAYLVNPAKSKYDLSEICNEYMQINTAPPETKSVQLSLLDDEPDSMDESIIYGRQAYALLGLRDVLLKKLEGMKQLNLYTDIELPLIGVLASMQAEGFKVDLDEIQRFGALLSSNASTLTDEIYELAGEEFNINSPKQLGVILFEKLNLPILKKSKTGYSTNAEILEKLADKHPIINKIIEYRSYTKLKSTYCDGLSSKVDKGGKIHSVFNQTVTVTGRISSSEPNLQNIPVRTELGRELRKMFVASDNDHVLVDADYSQIELRVLAHIANDPVMINAFLNNEDIHRVTASQVFDVPFDDVTSQMRSRAKAVNFGIVYGIGEYSLSQDLKIPIKEAKSYIENYLDKYTGVKEYMDSIKEKAKADGYVTTMFGRVRYIPELSSGNYNLRSFGERVALNTPIQGTAADIIKLAMVRVYKRLQSEGLKSKLILQVHDELIIDTATDELEKVKNLLSEEMENVIGLSVPLVADTMSGGSWYDAK